MLSSFELQTVSENFQRAASEFGFDFMESPQLEEGISAFGYIPNYGIPNGTIICLTEPPNFHINKDVLKWCEVNGYYCSFLNATLLTGPYDRAYFRAMLRDWGWHECASGI